MFTVSTAESKVAISQMQFTRRVDDKIRKLVAQALAASDPDSSVFAKLRSAMRYYAQRRAAENLLIGRRKDDFNGESAMSARASGERPNSPVGATSTRRKP